MGDPGMALRDEDVQRVVESAKPWLEETIRRTVLEIAPRAETTGDMELSQQIYGMQKELEAQRELMTVRFDGLMREMD